MIKLKDFFGDQYEFFLGGDHDRNTKNQSFRKERKNSLTIKNQMEKLIQGQIYVIIPTLIKLCIKILV